MSDRLAMPGPISVLCGVILGSTLSPSTSCSWFGSEPCLPDSCGSLCHLSQYVDVQHGCSIPFRGTFAENLRFAKLRRYTVTLRSSALEPRKIYYPQAECRSHRQMLTILAAGNAPMVGSSRKISFVLKANAVCGSFSQALFPGSWHGIDGISV